MNLRPIFQRAYDHEFWYRRLPLIGRWLHDQVNLGRFDHRVLRKPWLLFRRQRTARLVWTMTGCTVCNVRTFGFRVDA